MSQEPLVLKSNASMPPPWTIEAGFWRKDLYTDGELYEALGSLLERNADRMSLLMQALDRELPMQDGHLLARALTWLDAQLVFVHRLKDDADALLDIAEHHFNPSAGSSVLCTDDDGCLIPADNKGWSFNKEAADEQAIEKFKPRWNTLTTEDRKVECARRCVAFRRLRNEYKSVLAGLESKLYKASALLEELRARHRAAGVAERPR